MSELEVVLKRKIREVPDFPTPGILFKDIMPLLEDGQTFRAAIDGLAIPFRDSGIDKVVGIDARGFLFSSAVAFAIGAGLVSARKQGKLPFTKITQTHSLEYGQSLLEMHIDSIKPNERVLIVDDVLATGGTAEAVIKLVQRLGGAVAGAGFLIELSLGGRANLERYGVQVHSLVRY